MVVKYFAEIALIYYISYYDTVDTLRIVNYIQRNYIVTAMPAVRSRGNI